MNYTHILMPRKVKKIPIQEVRTDVDFLKYHPTYGPSEEVIIKYPDWVVVFNETEWGYDGMYTSISSNYFRELPKNAQEFPFGVDEAKPVLVETRINHPGTMGYSEARMGNELEHSNTAPAIMPRSLDDDEIPF